MSEVSSLTLCDELARRAAHGDAAAWGTLLELIWPYLGGFVRASRSMGPLCRSEDHVLNVVTAVIGKLGRDERQGLLLYSSWRARNADKGFEDWLRIVTANVVRDYVRHELRDALSRDPAEPSTTRLLNEFRTAPILETLGIRPPITAAQTARELLQFAEDRLPAEQLSALRAWLEGAEHDEIAQDAGLPEAEDARRLVRAAIATLRRHFVGGATGG